MDNSASSPLMARTDSTINKSCIIKQLIKVQATHLLGIF